MSTTETRSIADLCPSALIRVALEDLETCEQDPHYKIYMNDWHSTFGDQCDVCLAGAVMAQSLGAPRNCDLTPVGFTAEVETRLFALDSFRKGYVHADCPAANSLGQSAQSQNTKLPPTNSKPTCAN